RNKAIDLAWAKRYLEGGEDMPLWTHALRSICKEHLISSDATKCAHDSYKNHIIQDLHINTRDLPSNAKRVMATFKTHGIRFDPINPAQNIKEDLPIWHHIFIPKKSRPRYNTAACKCLRAVHNVHTVGDLLRFVSSIINNENHQRTKLCQCRACIEARTKGCSDPHRCVQDADKLAQKLPAKWDPRISFKAHYELTTPEVKRNKENSKKGGPVIFNPAIREEKSLEECYRVFGHNNSQDTQPRPDNPLADPDAPYRTVYLSERKNVDRATGKTTGLAAGIWSDTAGRTERKSVHTSRKTDGYALLTAMLDVLNRAETEENIELVIPQRSLIVALTKDLQRHDDEGWLNVPNRPQAQALVAKLRGRPGRTAMRSSRNEKGLTMANELATEGLSLGAYTHQTIASNPLEVRGAAMHKMTQKHFYNVLMEAKRPPVRTQTAPNIQHARTSAGREGRPPTDSQIWRSMRSRVLRRNVRQFLYKAAHDAHRCGRHWKDIPECEHRVYCNHCSKNGIMVEESLQHILTECAA
ncbi:hypothetical protein EV122DRAFT_180844, partial [Schizophyllum commune]